MSSCFFFKRQIINWSTERQINGCQPPTEQLPHRLSIFDSILINWKIPGNPSLCKSCHLLVLWRYYLHVLQSPVFCIWLSFVCINPKSIVCCFFFFFFCFFFILNWIIIYWVEKKSYVFEDFYCFFFNYYLLTRKFIFLET